MDVVRAYARWTRRRLLILPPAAASAALLGLHLWREEDLRDSARLALLSIAGLVELLLLGVIGLTLLCHRLHRARPREEARGVRHLLEPAERLVAPAVLLLLPLALAPWAFRRPEPPPQTFVFAAPRPYRTSTPPPPVEPPVPPPPLEVREPEPPPPEEVPAPVPARAPAPVVEDGDENDVFRLLREDLRRPEPRITFDRLGVPDDERPLEGRPLSIELEALVLWEDDGPTGSGLALRVDLPIDGGPILRLSALYVGDAGSPDLADGTPDFALSHSSLDVVLRILGGTRHATMDLRVGVGLAVDAADADGLDSGARLSPHVSLDLALWQAERVGFEFRVGQTIPISLSGGATALTDASAALRIDLSESVSLRAGWRFLVVHLRDYEGTLATGGVLSELDRDFSGPFIGLELRF